MDQASRLRALIGEHNGRHAAAIDPALTVDGASTSLVTAVTSGKGGVGKTALTVNLAILLAEQGKRVLIVDADLGLANVDVALGIECSRHIGHILLGHHNPEEVAVVGTGGVYVISGGSGLKELAEAGESDRQALRSAMSAYYRQFDHVLIDTSPGIGADVTDFLKDCDGILLVMTPEPTCLRDTYAVLKTLDRRMPEICIDLVVNMAVSIEQASQSVNLVNGMAEKFLNRCYEHWHHVEADPLIGRSIHSRRPLVMGFPRSPAALSIRRLSLVLSERGKVLLHERKRSEDAYAAFPVSS